MNIHCDTEYDIMCYCLKQKGTWWANHFFYNKEVGDLYSEIRSLPIDQVWNKINDENETGKTQII